MSQDQDLEPIPAAAAAPTLFPTYATSPTPAPAPAPAPDNTDDLEAHTHGEHTHTHGTHDGGGFQELCYAESHCVVTTEHCLSTAPHGLIDLQIDCEVDPNGAFAHVSNTSKVLPLLLTMTTTDTTDLGDERHICRSCRNLRPLHPVESAHAHAHPAVLMDHPPAEATGGSHQQEAHSSDVTEPALANDAPHLAAEALAAVHRAEQDTALAANAEAIASQWATKQAQEAADVAKRAAMANKIATFSAQVERKVARAVDTAAAALTNQKQKKN